MEHLEGKPDRSDSDEAETAELRELETNLLSTFLSVLSDRKLAQSYANRYMQYLEDDPFWLKSNKSEKLKFLVDLRNKVNSIWLDTFGFGAFNGSTIEQELDRQLPEIENYIEKQGKNPVEQVLLKDASKAPAKQSAAPDSPVSDAWATLSHEQATEQPIARRSTSPTVRKSYSVDERAAVAVKAFAEAHGITESRALSELLLGCPKLKAHMPKLEK